MNPQSIQLDAISARTGTQIRAKICIDTVDDYANAMKDGAEFPPIVIFKDGSEFILADGFHRVMAARRNRAEEITADVRNGSKTDALRYALSANVTHGLRRTNADKRHSVLLAVEAWPGMSDRELANVCAVDNHTVASVRNENASTGEIPQLPIRTGKDGKKRKLPKRKERKQPASPPSPEPEPVHIQTAEQVIANDVGQPDDELVICQEALQAFLNSFNALTKEANRETIRESVKFNLERM